MSERSERRGEGKWFLGRIARSPHDGQQLMRDRWPVLAVVTSTAVVLTASSALHSKSPRTSAVHAVTGFTVEGADESYEPSTKPRIEAAFRRESYRSGSVGKLVIFSKRVRRVSVQLFRAGTEDDRISSRDEMHGTPVSAPRQLGIVRRTQGVWVPIPDSPSGLYFAKLTGAGNVSGTRRSSFDHGVSVKSRLPSSCQLLRGRHTTGATTTGTVELTRGTPTRP